MVTAFTPHSGEVGIGYAAITITAHGGTPPYQWSVGGGALPPGLSLSGGGQLSGTPSGAGGFSFAALVTDAAGVTASLAKTIGVAQRMSVIGTCVVACQVERGCASVCGGFGYITGGVAPFHVALVGGLPPGGMGISGLTLTGTFPDPAPNDYSIGVLVTDALGAQGSTSADFHVFPQIALPSGAKCPQTSAGCVVQIPYSGGTPNINPTVTVGPFSAGSPPPNGYTATVSGGVLTFTAGGQVYTSNVTVVLTDASLCGPGGSTRCTTSVTITITL